MKNNIVPLSDPQVAATVERAFDALSEFQSALNILLSEAIQFKGLPASSWDAAVTARALNLKLVQTLTGLGNESSVREVGFIWEEEPTP